MRDTKPTSVVLVLVSDGDFYWSYTTIFEFASQRKTIHGVLFFGGGGGGG